MHAVLLTMSMLFCYLFQFYRGKNESNALLKNSSLFVAYMGCLGWEVHIFTGGVSLFIMVSHGGCQCRY